MGSPPGGTDRAHDAIRTTTPRSGFSYGARARYNALFMNLRLAKTSQNLLAAPSASYTLEMSRRPSSSRAYTLMAGAPATETTGVTAL